MKAVNGMKVCSKCKVEKPVEEYGKNRAKADGLRGDCKACGRERDRRYYEANREKALEYYRKRREANLEEERERSREWHKANREKVLEQKRKHYEANREKLLERKRKHYEANPLHVKRSIRTKHEMASKRNAYSLSVATRTGLPFTEVEDAIILSRPVNLELALELGRGLKSVSARKNRLRKKMKEGAA